MAKSKSKNKPEQTEAEKLQAKKDLFARVVPTRVNNAVKAIRLVKQCASNSYSATQEQKNAVVTAIMNEVTELKEAFEGNAKAAGGFTLPKG
jgi:hypothetical protein